MTEVTDDGLFEFLTAFMPSARRIMENSNADELMIETSNGKTTLTVTVKLKKAEENE